MNNITAFLVSVAAFSGAVVPAHAAESGRWVNLRAMPIGMLLGEYMGDLSFAILPWLSVGAIGYHSAVDISGVKVDGSGAGATFAAHLAGNRFSTSYYFRGYYYKTGRIKMSEPALLGGPPLEGTIDSIAETGLLFGRHWVWDSGFNISLGVGARKIDGIPRPMTLTSSGGGTATYGNLISRYGMRIEFALGWAF